MLFFDDKPIPSVPIMLPDHTSYTTHRTVTPVLASSRRSHVLGEYTEWELSPKKGLFSPKSDRFLVPPDYDTIFSSQQTLGVSKCGKPSSSDSNPVSPVFCSPSSAQFVSQDKISRASEAVGDFTFAPGFRRDLSEFERAASESELNTPNVTQKKASLVAESPHPSDSELEFFDCQDFFEPDDVMTDDEITYHISEPPSPRPRRSPDMGLLRDSSECTTQHFLHVEDDRRLSSASEGLGEFAYDLDVSWEHAAEGGFPMCEELPSRGQAGFCDDDDFLGMVRG